MYTGCDYDADTGLTYHWNRWRSEDGSCFISEDPARDGANWYGYAGQNPMVYTDPTGLAPYLNGIYDGPYNPDYNPGTPEIGPPPNPNGMPPNQTPSITGPSNVQTSLPPVPDVKTDGRNLNEKIIETERKSKTVLDWIQTALDVLGVIPVFGEAADGIIGLISLGRGDELGAALSFASMIPVVGDAVGKGGKAVKQLVKYADDGLSKATKVASKTISDAAKTKGLHRPYIRKSTREAVENAAQKNAKGQFIDPNTLQPIEGKYDLGHKRGNEFRTEKAKAEREGVTQSQFNDRMNNPDLYQIENPSSNRSHKYEAPRE